MIRFFTHDGEIIPAVHKITFLAMIQKSDKGNSVVISNRDDYLEKMNELISDRNTFEKLDVKSGKDYNFKHT